jgi:hypothetical protein
VGLALTVLSVTNFNKPGFLATIWSSGLVITSSQDAHNLSTESPQAYPLLTLCVEE